MNKKTKKPPKPFQPGHGFPGRTNLYPHHQEQERPPPSAMRHYEDYLDQATADVERANHPANTIAFEE